jgi:acyl-CoA reductase-like NAD-dependent aldehyde dehydrogenase
MQVTNPYTLETAHVNETTDLNSLFREAQQSYLTWSKISTAERVARLSKALERLQSKRDSVVTMIATEMGKPVSHGRLEFDRSVEEWSYLLSNAEAFLEPELVNGAEIHFDPLGVVAVISPWNFPLLLPLRAIIPALLAGNTVICKPSELSPRVGLCLAEILSADAPLFVATGGKELGAQLVELPVRAIAFTGSTAVGKAIARESASSLKRVILELGGLDAAVVLADADVSHAACEIVKANARNTGQVCNAAKRALVHESIYQRFCDEAIQAAQKLVYGDPLHEKTDVGPLVSKTQYERVQSFLADALAQGAKATQVDAPKQGFLFPQTILTQVPPTARLLREEPFGPLLPVLPFSTEEQAIGIANDTPFGLTASVWTSDTSAFKRIAGRLEVGLVRHNTHAAMQSGIPWGGAKESGIGRMKTKEGLREFTNVKAVG